MAKKEANISKDKKSYYKDFKAEIKKVIWPTPKELLNTTVAVITIVLVIAFIVFILDMAFEAFNKYGLTNLQEYVQTTFGQEENVVEDNTTSTENTTAEENTATNETNTTEATGEETNTAAEDANAVPAETTDANTAATENTTATE